MSETVKLGVRYEVENFDEMVKGTYKLLSNVNMLRYAWHDYARLTEEFNIQNFLGAALTTLEIIRRLRDMTWAATLAQQAWNAAKTIGLALSGPTGWAILGMGTVIATATATSMVAQSQRTRYGAASVG